VDLRDWEADVLAAVEEILEAGVVASTDVRGAVKTSALAIRTVTTADTHHSIKCPAISEEAI